MKKRLKQRAVYALEEPRHVLKPGEWIGGWGEQGRDMTQWIILREVRRQRRSKRRHDGRLRKRRAA